MPTYTNRGLHGQVVRGVGLRIVEGQLPPLAIIDLDDLGGEFGVSRTVIREALKVLTGKGLVDARPKRGTFVRERADWNLLDPDVLRWQFESEDSSAMAEKLAELRDIVEPATAALAAARRTDADLAELKSALHDLSTLKDTQSLVSADIRFHRGLLRATHNELLGQLAVIVEIGLQARDTFVHDHQISIDHGLPGHERVFKAVAAGDSAAAQRAMNTLLRDAVKDVRTAIRGTKRK